MLPIWEQCSDDMEWCRGMLQDMLVEKIGESSDSVLGQTLKSYLQFEKYAYLQHQHHKQSIPSSIKHASSYRVFLETRLK